MVDDESSETTSRRQFILTHLAVPAAVGALSGFVGAASQNVLEERFGDKHQLRLTATRDDQAQFEPIPGTNDQRTYYIYDSIVTNSGDFVEDAVHLQIFFSATAEGGVLEVVHEPTYSSTPPMLSTNVELIQTLGTESSQMLWQVVVGSLNPGEAVKLQFSLNRRAWFYVQARSSSDWAQAVVSVQNQSPI